MTVVSIEVDSIQQNPTGAKRRVPEAEFAAVASACAKLLEQLGPLGKQVEVLKVVPWHGYNRPNIYDIKAILSIKGDDTAKVEAKHTFEHIGSVGHCRWSWDLNALSARIVADMKGEICRAVTRKHTDLTLLSAQWQKLLPVSEAV